MSAQSVSPTASVAPTWDLPVLDDLIAQLWALRESMLAEQRRLRDWIDSVDSAHRASAGNLAHYLAMRRVDLRALQERLAWLGVSSLGRAESHVLANVDKVLGILHRLAGRQWDSRAPEEPAGFNRGPALLAAHAQALFGSSPTERTVRIMVTLPSEAAHDPALIDAMIAAGMDIARINCAHDDPCAWEAMARGVRDAAERANRPVRVLMDLGGPKLRTGPLAEQPAVLKLRPLRDAFGCVVSPATLGLRARGSKRQVPGAALSIAVEAAWLARLEPGRRIELTDARAARRRLTVVACGEAGALVESERTAYLSENTRLQLHDRGHDHWSSAIDELPAPPGTIRVYRGDTLRLVAQGLGHDAVPASNAWPAVPATIACTLPAVLAAVREGERIWFDDGRIGGIVRAASPIRVDVEITEAREGGERLAADKGINLPDTQWCLPALTQKDIDDLAMVARQADIVGLSFAQSAADVRALRARLLALDAGHVGIMLKIETRRGFEHLPEMLMAVMAGPAAGVMIARGDLAVECGYERLAEVQEEILWACEAAHLPVVWATQVLETLARTGLPSRAEITDAAMGGRAECVMLNKGPHILAAIGTLDRILGRMRAHQSKKRPLLRALKSWDLGAETLDDRPGHESRTQGA